MNYFFYNTDAKSREKKNHTTLLNRNLAITGGPIKYGKYLGKLSPGDILLMYEKMVGIVTIGRVMEYWDQVSHAEPIYYTPGINFGENDREYRIKVDWFVNRPDSPIHFRDVKSLFGYIPQSAVVRIVKKRQVAEELVAKYGDI